MTWNRTFRRILTMALVAALVAAPTAAVAQTQASPSDVAVGPIDVKPVDDLDEIKKRALAAIEEDLKTIRRLVHKVETHEHVTNEHAGLLLRDLIDAAESLKRLAHAIEDAKTLEQLRPLVRAIVTKHRVDQLLVPKVHQVLKSDALVWKAKKLERRAAKLAEIIERLANAGYDVEKLKRLLGQMRKHVAAGGELAAHVAPAVIVLQPDDWPEAREVLAKGKRALNAAHKHLRNAKRIGKEIAKIIRELIGDVA